MKVKGTYFQNDKEKPLVYGDVEIINPKRRRLRGEEEKEGKKDHVSIGITNVKTRLTLNYGESCEFEMESEKGRFTRTSIRIPIKRKEPEDL